LGAADLSRALSALVDDPEGFIYLKFHSKVDCPRCGIHWQPALREDQSFSS
jgi:hypothetical protein